MVSASILVPYHPDKGHRDTSWKWVRSRWERLLPDYPIYIGDSVGVHGFHCTAASNHAASQSDSDVLVFTDCDTTTNPEWVREAVEQVGNEEIPWALYRLCHKLDEASTLSILQSDPGGAFPPYETVEVSHFSVGGVLVVPRRGFKEVGGYDERFTVWGAYDACFTMAMSVLWGNPVRFDSIIYHLWHPQNTRELFNHPEQRKQQELTQSYTLASTMGKEAMRKVRFG